MVALLVDPRATSKRILIWNWFTRMGGQATSRKRRRQVKLSTNFLFLPITFHSFMFCLGTITVVTSFPIISRGCIAWTSPLVGGYASCNIFHSHRFSTVEQDAEAIQFSIRFTRGPLGTIRAVYPIESIHPRQPNTIPMSYYLCQFSPTSLILIPSIF